MECNNVDIKDFSRYVGLSMLSKGLSVSPLKLQKLLYYIQAWHMVFFGRERTLFAETPHAWVNGPVYPDIYYEYRDKTANMCDHLGPQDFGLSEREDVLDAVAELSARLGLSEDQIGLVDSVINLYGSKTQNQLIFITHSERPWCEQREGLLPYQKSDREISLDTMYSYYKERHDRNRAARKL